MMFSQNLFCHLLICAAVMLGPVAAVVSFSTTSDGDVEEDCKFLSVRYTTQCISPNVTIRELSSTSGLSAVCSTTLTHRVVDTKKGTVELSILLPHNAANEWIYLFALEPPIGEDPRASCSRNLHGKHSFFQLLEEGENQSNCSFDQLMEITWKANYLYTGCYMVKADLPYPEPEKNCASEPFYVQTEFEMEPLAYQNLSVTRKSINDKLTIILEKELVLNNDCSYPMISSSCVRIKLILEEQDLPIVKATVFPNCPVVSFSANFHHNYPKTTIVKLSSNNTYTGKMFACCITSLDCSCDWKKPQLECTFPDLPVGNYCVQVEALDTRCVRDTVWVNSSLIKKMNNTDPCVWEICNLEMKNETGKYIPTEHSKRTPISWLIVVFAMAAVGAICISLYLRARKNLVFRSPNTANVPIDDGPCEKLIDSPQVLLLYARDCRPFMEAMVEFRNLLQRTTGVKVYDIWDSRQREEMDANGETWVLNNLSAENTQVVVLATPISRVFEDGFLSGNKRGYLVPDSRDEIFLSAFHTSIRMTATHSNRCRKFIVARMNFVGCSENILTSFKPLSTIYTLPTHLDRLLLHVLSAKPLHNSLGVQQFEEPFRRKAEELEKYVSANPSYLECIVK